MTEENTPLIYSRAQHRLSRSKIDPDALKIMYRLIRNGHIAYLVGGGVRDVLLNKQPKDFDIATDATPRQVKSLFRNSRIIGRRFKLVHVFFNGGKNIEVSTFRDASEEQEDNTDASIVEAEAKGLLADNVFGTAQSDARRRDLTINALFYNVADYSIIDYVGGMQDLKDGIIRVIGDPAVRFQEDPVRMLRVIRHSARTGFVIDEWCGQTLKDCRELLKKASQVRVYEEFRKDLCSGYVLESLRGLLKYELLDLLLPRFVSLGGNFLEEGAHLPICLERIDNAVKSGAVIPATITLATLFLKIEPHLIDESDTSYDVGEIIRYAFASLVVPRKERERIESLVESFKHAVEVQENGGTFKKNKYVDNEELIILYGVLFGEEAAKWLRSKITKTSKRSAKKQ